MNEDIDFDQDERRVSNTNNSQTSHALVPYKPQVQNLIPKPYSKKGHKKKNAKLGTNKAVVTHKMQRNQSQLQNQYMEEMNIEPNDMGSASARPQRNVKSVVPRRNLAMNPSSATNHTYAKRKLRNAQNMSPLPGK